MPKPKDSSELNTGDKGTVVENKPRAFWFSAISNRMSRFSKRARQVLDLAQTEANGFNHNYIGTEHILLALLREGEGVGAKALVELGVAYEDAQAAVENVIGRGDGTVPAHLAVTPRCKKVLELALDEARRLGHSYVGTEHLLLGLLREGEGVAAGVLEGFGIGLQHGRDKVLALLVAPGRQAETAGTNDNVLTCRIDAHDLQAIDLLVESGIRATRSETAAWLIHAGIDANKALFAKLDNTAAEIRRLREAARSIAQRFQQTAPRDAHQQNSETSPSSPS